MSVILALYSIGTDFLLLLLGILILVFIDVQEMIHTVAFRTESRNAMISLDWKRRISEDLGNELKGKKDGQGWRKTSDQGLCPDTRIRGVFL